MQHIHPHENNVLTLTLWIIYALNFFFFSFLFCHSTSTYCMASNLRALPTEIAEPVTGSRAHVCEGARSRADTPPLCNRECRPRSVWAGLRFRDGTGGGLAGEAESRQFWPGPPFLQREKRQVWGDLIFFLKKVAVDWGSVLTVWNCFLATFRPQRTRKANGLLAGGKTLKDNLKYKHF